MKEMKNVKMLELDDLSKVNGGYFRDEEYERVIDYIEKMYEVDEQYAEHLGDLMIYYDNLEKRYTCEEFLNAVGAPH